MERFDKNLLRLMAIELDMPSLIKFCKTNKRINKEVCQSQDFWRNKLNKEFPNTIGKFYIADFRKIYLSLINKEVHTYYIFISQENKQEDNLPKIFDYIKETPINEEDYDLAEKLYPDFSERMGEENSFKIVGDFPHGTKIWLAYCDDWDYKISEAFLTREEAINKLSNVFNYFIEIDFKMAGEFEEEMNMTPEIFYGGKLDEIKKRYLDTLNEKGQLQIRSHDNRRNPPIFPVNFIIKEFEIIDYEQLLQGLIKINPYWDQLPPEMIEQILSFLKSK